MKRKIQTLTLAGILALAGTGCHQPARSDKNIKVTLTLMPRFNIDGYLKNMQTGFASPLNIEFQIRDMDEDGKNELTLSYGTNNYLVRTEGTNNLRVIPYVRTTKVTELD